MLLEKPGHPTPCAAELRWRSVREQRRTIRAQHRAVALAKCFVTGLSSLDSNRSVRSPTVREDNLTRWIEGSKDALANARASDTNNVVHEQTPIVLNRSQFAKLRLIPRLCYHPTCD